MANGEVDNVPPSELRQLQPTDDLLRVLVKKVWMDRSGLHEAFMLRPNENELSVCYDCQPEQCFDLSPQLTRMYGVASLKVNRVTALNLTVVPDSQNHAAIQGVPHKDVNPTEAEWFASRLAEAATIVDRIKRER
ncbi:MAG: hypothetical protein ACHQT6_11570 [Candidatus Acidiferrales bacterium]